MRQKTDISHAKKMAGLYFSIRFLASDREYENPEMK
tara:strand:+ start:1312 stop:1419 length:108 start_codon:yes stop_codon:yes gene_type:complete